MGQQQHRTQLSNDLPNQLIKISNNPQGKEQKQ
jgi:hypothetical protein